MRLRDLAVALLVAALAFPPVFLSCSDSEEPKPEFVTPTPEELPCTCEEAYAMLYKDCQAPLTGTDGNPISLEEAMAGCEMCSASNEYAEAYCCIRACCDNNDSCEGTGNQKGMVACINKCLVPPAE